MAIVFVGAASRPCASSRGRGGGQRVPVSKSQEEGVKKYAAGQAEHHKKEDFRAELLRMLRLHEIELDERYVFD